MPHPPIDVDPSAYEAASRYFGTHLANGIADVYLGLQSDLAGTTTMAGSDPGGREWSDQYDKYGPQIASAIEDLCLAGRAIARLLQQTGFNHGMAEAHSDPTRRVPTPADTNNYDVSPTQYGQPGGTGWIVPLAAGGSGDKPAGWDQVTKYVVGGGQAFPDGRQDRLRHASHAWHRAGRHLANLTRFVDEAINAISWQVSSEVQDAVTVCAAMRPHVEAVSSACHTLGHSCTELARHIDTAHRNISRALKILVGASAATQFIGGVAAVFTAGLAEIPTQIAEGGEIAAVGAEVNAYILTWQTESETVTLLVSSVDSELLAVDAQVRAVVAAEVRVAQTEVVPTLPPGVRVGGPGGGGVGTRVAALLPKAGVTDAASLALARLNRAASSIWRLGWSKRGFEIEEIVGNNLGASFPVVDRLEKGIVTSVKSVDLTAPTYQNTVRLQSRLESYVDKVKSFNGATFDGVDVRADMIKGRSLQIVVQPGAASQAQIEVLERVITYGKARGVSIVVTEVP